MPEKPGPQQRLLLTCSEHDWVLPNSDLDENGCPVLGWECQATHTTLARLYFLEEFGEDA